MKVRSHIDDAVNLLLSTSPSSDVRCGLSRLPSPASSSAATSIYFIVYKFNADIGLANLLHLCCNAFKHIFAAAEQLRPSWVVE
jgi:hypothetical protein